MDIITFFKQYSFIFIIILFTFLFFGFKLLLNTQDKDIANNKNDILTFTEKNIFYLIFTIFLILIIFYIYNIVRFYEKSPIQKIKPSYEKNHVYDTGKPIIIKNTILDCPQNDKKFSFCMFLQIDDYYCNRGFWKCIFLKGTNISNFTPISSCSINSNIPEEPKEIVDFENETEFEDDLEILKKIIPKNADDKYTHFSYDNRNLRVNTICKFLNSFNGRTEDKINNLFELLVGKYKLINEKTYPGFVARRILNQHKKYCELVFTKSKKVKRRGDPNLINIPKDDNRKYYDDYDNTCSLDNLNLDENYKYLLPDTIGMSEELDLIDLSNQNNMDLYNNNKNRINTIEGDYYIPYDKLILEGSSYTISASGFDTSNLSYTPDLFNKYIIYINKTTKDKIQVKYDTIEIIGNFANEKGYEYIGEPITFGVIGGRVNFTASQESTSQGSTILKKYTIVKNIKELYKYKIEPQSGEYIHLKVSKILNNEKTALYTCWKNIIDISSIQSPGVWLHPFVNNIRICVTTFSDKDYKKEMNDITQAYKFTNKNYYISAINKTDLDKKVQDTYHVSEEEEEQKVCATKNPNKEKEQFTNIEYFDVINVPIKEEFHLAIILNENIIEVYIDGKLKESIKLFGKIKYSNGDLQINTGNHGRNSKNQIKKILLGGNINFFKYYPYVLKPDNIINVLNDRSDDIKVETTNIVEGEHNHNIEISHEHHYDSDIETEHKHSVGDNDIKHDYYLDDY